MRYYMQTGFLNFVFQEKDRKKVRKLTFFTISCHSSSSPRAYLFHTQRNRLRKCLKLLLNTPHFSMRQRLCKSLRRHTGAEHPLMKSGLASCRLGRLGRNGVPPLHLTSSRTSRAIRACATQQDES